MNSLYLACVALLAASAAAKNATTWVAESRLNPTSYSPEEKYSISIDANCTPVTTKGGLPHTGPITLTSGMGSIVEICAIGGPHYFTAPEFLAASALRKAESTGASGGIGYAKGDVMSECEAFDQGCCAMFVVPVNDGNYFATDKLCGGGTPLQIANMVVTGQMDTLEQETSPEFLPPNELLAAKDGAWPGWASALNISVALIEESACQPAPAGRRLSRALLQTPAPVVAEGDGEDVGVPVKLKFVHAGGHTGVMSTFGPPKASVEGEGSTVGTPGAPVNEGADGIYEGGGEGAATGRRLLQPATPAPSEGADGIYEGGGEGEGATPAPSEGADGIYEGGGEGEGATPAPSEGADGIYEGGGEGEGMVGAPMPAVDAGLHPIEMVVGKAYRITFNLVRSRANHYFSAKDFFIKAVTRKFQDTYSEYKWATYPTEFELFGDANSIDFYVVPYAAGNYPLTSGSLPAESLNGAMIRVVATEAELTPPTAITTQEVVTGTACPAGTVATPMPVEEVPAPAPVAPVPAPAPLMQQANTVQPVPAANGAVSVTALLGAAVAAVAGALFLL